MPRTHSLCCDYGEERCLSIGHIEGLLHFYIWDWRGDIARLISLKKASDDEHVICDKSYGDEDNEAPELDEAFFAKAGRGRLKLPIELRKQQIISLLDLDVISHFEGARHGWQIRINAALREVVGLQVF